MRSCEQTTCGAFIAISISFMSRPLHSLTQLEPKGEDVSIQARRKKNQTQDAGALAGFSPDKPRKARPSKTLFQLWDVHQSIQIGTFRGNLGTSDRHSLYTPPLFWAVKKERSKFLQMKRVCSLHLYPHSPTPSFTKLRKRASGRHVKRT